MSGADAPPGGKPPLVLLLAAIPFLASVFLLAVGLRTGILLAFAIGWPLFQAVGYTVAYRLAKGDLGNPLFKSQVALHWLMLALLGAVLARAL